MPKQPDLHLAQGHHIKRRQHQPEVELAEPFAVHPPAGFREPVIDRGKKWEDKTPEHRRVEVADNPVRIVKVEIGGNCGIWRPSQTAEQEDRDASKHEEHGRWKGRFFPATWSRPN